ncbi:MAG: uL22 family ribosomal protein [Candidatus Shapirobacteria bacterium]
MAITKKIIKTNTETKALSVAKPGSAGPKFAESVYNDKNIQISPRKLRLLVETSKKLTVLSALSKLKFTNTKSARVLTKAIETAVATAKNNYNLIPETLKFTSFIVNEGPKQKRTDKSHGSRFARGIIIRRHSRLTMVVKGQVK